MPTYQIIDVLPDHNTLIHQIAEMLVEGFRRTAPGAWPDLESGIQEVQESLTPERISRVAVDERGVALGWIGGIPTYDTHAWELHPLIVHPDRQRQGIGRALVVDLEAQVLARGGITIYLGSDDSIAQTSIGGIDLCPNVLEHLLQIQNRDDHAFSFYRKCGYVIVGVIPDAGSMGEPDILLAKRLVPFKKA